MIEICCIVGYVDLYGYRDEVNLSLYAPDTPLVRNSLNYPEILEEICKKRYREEHPNHTIVSIKIISIRE